jgi:hypothetical protein
MLTLLSDAVSRESVMIVRRDESDDHQTSGYIEERAPCRSTPGDQKPNS